jgi:hypothetical protein
MVAVAGRHAPALWLCFATIELPWPLLGVNDPVNPAAVHAARALETVLPTRFGTVLHVGTGVGVGVGVGRGVGRGVGGMVGGGVGAPLGVGAGVRAGPTGGVVGPPSDAPVPFGRAVAPGVARPPITLADASADGEPAVDDAASVLTAPTGGADRFALPAFSGSPPPRVRTSARTTMRPPNVSMTAAPPRPSDLVRPSTAIGVAAAAAAVAKYGKAHSGQSPEASAQHHLHEYRWQCGQWQSPTWGPIAGISARRPQWVQNGLGGSPLEPGSSGGMVSAGASAGTASVRSSGTPRLGRNRCGTRAEDSAGH